MRQSARLRYKIIKHWLTMLRCRFVPAWTRSSPTVVNGSPMPVNRLSRSNGLRFSFGKVHYGLWVDFMSQSLAGWRKKERNNRAIIHAAVLRARMKPDLPSYFYSLLLLLNLASRTYWMKYLECRSVFWATNGSIINFYCSIIEIICVRSLLKSEI